MAPFVSIIIPCRNEEKFLGKCLDTIINQDYPKESLEVLVADGSSGDKTKEIAADYAKKHSFIKVLDNPQKYTSFGLNMGIKKARGEIIVRMDAHAGYEKDYISKCVKTLEELNADNVGGAIKTLPAKDTIEAKAIAYVLSGPLGAASAFRLGSAKVREVDTVFGGCYKREVFDKIGFFDERMIRSQDIEFNKRLKKAGGKIILSPEINSIYYPQATLFGFLMHNFSDGVWVTYPLKFGVRYFSLRHLFPLCLTGVLALSFLFGLFSIFGRMLFILLLFPYFSFVFLMSLKISFKKGLAYFPDLFLAVLIRHFAYGLGSIWGLAKAIF
jgi:glycosyltransferase involved in cell wall biosynthesis